MVMVNLYTSLTIYRETHSTDSVAVIRKSVKFFKDQNKMIEEKRETQH